MIARLNFGSLRLIESGKKKGRWYVKATIPSEYVKAYGDTQCTLWLGTGLRSEAQARLPKKEAAKQKQYLTKIATHDPLLVAAELLYEALFSRHNDITGRKLPVAEWYPSPITKEELVRLKHFTRDESLERTEFNRIVQSLRNEVYKVLYAEHDRQSVAEVVQDNIVWVKSTLLDTDATPDAKQKALADIDLIDDNIAMGLDIVAPRYQHWKAMGWLAKFITSLQEEGRTDQEIKFNVKALYASGALGYSFDAVNKRDKINNAFKGFEDEHGQRIGTKTRVGKRYSEAMAAWLEKQNDPNRDDLKRMKTRDEYIKSQRIFIELFGDVDLSDITSRNALDMIEHLEKQGKAQGTITKHLSGMRAPLARAIELSWIEEDPTLGVKVKKRGKPAKKTHNWERSDLQRFLCQKLPVNLRLLYQILICTGFRLEEAAALEWRDIKVDDNGINFFDLRDLNKKLKTEHAMRLVPMHKELLPLIEAYALAEGREGRLFHYKKDKDGKCNKEAVKHIAPYLKTARMEDGVLVKHLKTHGLRGTFTSLCANNGMADSMRRFLGGWRQVGEDTHYLEPNLASQNEILQRIDFSFITTRSEA